MDSRCALHDLHDHSISMGVLIQVNVCVKSHDRLGQQRWSPAVCEKWSRRPPRTHHFSYLHLLFAGIIGGFPRRTENGNAGSFSARAIFSPSASMKGEFLAAFCRVAAVCPPTMLLALQYRKMIFLTATCILLQFFFRPYSPLHDGVVVENSSATYSTVAVSIAA